MEKRKVFKISIIDKEISRTEFDRNTFYTSDSELSLVFKFIEKDYSYDRGEILLYNEDDKSFVTRKITKQENDFVYEIDSDIIPHYGRWQAQLQLVNDGDVYTSKPFEFVIENDLSNLAPQPTLTDINNWSTLKQSANELIDEMQGMIISIEQAELERINKENLRQKAESERYNKENYRQQAESERVNKENYRQQAESERVNKENARQQAESERESQESKRQQAEFERENKENSRQQTEVQRKKAEQERVENEEKRKIYHDNIRAELDSKADRVIYEYSPTLLSGYVGGSAGKEKIRIYKDSFGFVHISGRVEGSRLFGESNPIFNIPKELRPLYVQTGAVCLGNVGSIFTGIRIVSNNGNCYFTSEPQAWTIINFSYFAGL